MKYIYTFKDMNLILIEKMTWEQDINEGAKKIIWKGIKTLYRLIKKIIFKLDKKKKEAALSKNTDLVNEYSELTKKYQKRLDSLKDDLATKKTYRSKEGINKEIWALKKAIKSM